MWRGGVWSEFSFAKIPRCLRCFAALVAPAPETTTDMRTTEPWCERTMAISPVTATQGSLFGVRAFVLFAQRRGRRRDRDARFSIYRTVYFFGLRFGVAERALVVASGRRESSRSSLVCWIISFSQIPVIFFGTPA